MPITKDKKTDIMLAGAVVGALGIGAVVLNQPKPEPVNENTNDENAVLETGNKVTNAVNDAVEKAKVEAEAQEKARLEAEEKARLEAEEKARLEAEARAKAEAEERARLDAQRAQQTQQSAPVSRPATTTPARTQSTPTPAPSTNTQSNVPAQKQAEDDAIRSKFAPKGDGLQRINQDKGKFLTP